jgi:hypothetical protein
MYVAPSKLYKPNLSAIPGFLEPGEVALAIAPIGFNNKVLTTRRVLFLDTNDSQVKEFISLEKVKAFEFGSTMGTPRIDARMKDGTLLKIGTIQASWLTDLKVLFTRALSGEAQTLVETDLNLGATGAQVSEPTSTATATTEVSAPTSSSPQYRTNSLKALPSWLEKSIETHKSTSEQLLMIITEPYTNHQGALLVFENRCMIVKGGFWGGLMAGSLGGERAATFYFTQITGIEYNSGMLTGVLEILTASYQGTANKDFWRGTNQSRNADSNDPWTLSNTLPLTKEAYKSAMSMIDEMKRMIAEAQRPAAPAAAPAPVGNLADEIAKLSDLREKGLLTEAEFAAAKAKLLG